MKKKFSFGVPWLCCLPVSPEDRMLLETVTLSSEFLAQSTMPLQPFMGKVMSVAALAGSLWMPRTRGKQERKPVSKPSLSKFTCAEKTIGGNSEKSREQNEWGWVLIATGVVLSSSNVYAWRKMTLTVRAHASVHWKGPACTKPGRRESGLLQCPVSRSGQ